MSLQELVTSYISNSGAFKEFCKNKDSIYHIDGIDNYPFTRLVELSKNKINGRVWVITPTDEIARSIAEDMEDVKSTRIILLPPDGKLLYSEHSASAGEWERKKALEEIAESKEAIIITSLRSFSSPVISRDVLSSLSLNLKKGDRFDLSGISRALSEAGYSRSPSCYEEGTFSLRGEVMDIYPFSSDKPVRLYADWEEIERITYYDPVNQQSTKSLSSVKIPLMTESTDDNLSFSKINTYFEKNDYFFLFGIERLETSFLSVQKEAKSRFNEAYKKNPDALPPDKLVFDYHEFRKSLKTGMFIYDIADSDHYHFSVSSSRSYFGNFTYFKEDITSLLENGWKIFVVALTHVQKERLESVLKGFDVNIIVRDFSSGFQIESIRLLVVLDQEIFGRQRKRNKAVIENVSTSPLDSFVELKEGDYVVHVNYGIGQFVKIERVKTKRTERDYIKILYNNDEYLYVPIEQANLVQKYIGNDGRVPKKDTIGSQSWTKKKERAIKSAQDLARMLTRLYAERQVAHGFPFMRDNDWQTQFEASFPYTETPDQLKCLEEIKKDMESDKVMDRLVCGDVGYGKTEVAFRAAFKAIMSGKQVIFLAPTVILSEQHYQNFIDRLGVFPVKAACLTRFTSQKEKNSIKAGLSDGSVDIVFGTHAILNRSFSFKNLGLLIVDEEQRFGVKDKEKIKDLKKNIDALTLSATPIPRTLYMSLLKVRDMSLLTTAPRERQPIETFIGEYNFDTVVAAIKKELERGGQVFYLHNRVEDLEEVAQSLRKALPAAIIEGAHGRMDGLELEEIMHRFVYEGIQVLVSTTIIENGIDIPNVNTIIIDRADRLGLSQIYQLRGRVGRSDRNAYCYLFYPHRALLTEDAIKRLRVLSENTGLGSGFKIAMKDMEIRGAGNILGREQSGHLEAVGLEMYLKMLEDEIDQIEGNEEKRDVLLELDYTGFIPDSYIQDPAVKFEMYKKISSIATDGQLEGVKNEIENRFGQMPEEVENLFCIAELKIILRKLSAYHLKERDGSVEIEFSQVYKIKPEKIVNLMMLSSGRVTIDEKRTNVLRMKTDAISLRDKALFIVEQLRRIL